MNLKKSNFELVKRGFLKTLVLIPGWATDYRVFGNLDLQYNYLLPKQFSYSNFSQELSDALEKYQLNKVSLFGWSQGGFLAADFAQRNPQNIDELFLLSVRGHYEKEALLKVKENLERDVINCLSAFYANCFSSFDSQAAEWFKNNLLNVYLKEMKIEDLIQGLRFLSSAQIDPLLLEKIPKIRIFHGKLDRIAPFIEVEQLKQKINHADLVIFPRLGHNLFLNQEFAQKFPHE
ncbi:MAG: alpha/beta hydrolase [Candidatus Omnitrophica bacterium]|nr:alpha/beta hydrolase [Candidatus Omnitrophota bacterium]